MLLGDFNHNISIHIALHDISMKNERVVGTVTSLVCETPSCVGGRWSWVLLKIGNEACLVLYI
ncbi:hypothetical protein M6B38_335230 [Iris pallida]|uniref:Uncharacterized protein n=1 Tax=Iris pallida TaxID=29817 RepID=A0AAX6DUF1_IRIPA|nr:hypothetical protein M6B38_226685 [Iris pallida]KAJ6834571.1 hypothetical protein M6B38_335230 [Iris pallida]